MKSALVALLLVLAAGLFGLSVWLWTPDLRREQLEAAYLRGPGDLIDVGGQQLHVRDTGRREAPAIVMLHGFGSSLHAFEPWSRALESDYRVISLDLPGSGLSGPDPVGIYTDDRTIELVLGLLDRLGVARATLVGNSIGGRLAWRFAGAHPDRVDKLVLIAPDGFASPGLAYGRAPDVSAAMELMRYVLPRSLLRRNLAAAYGDPAALSEPTTRRYHDLMRAPGNRAAMIARWRQTVLVDPEPILRRIEAPVLLVWGSKDAMIPERNAADYLRLMPKARLVTFPTLGHVPHEEAPDSSLAPVREFLRER